MNIHYVTPFLSNLAAGQVGMLTYEEEVLDLMLKNPWVADQVIDISLRIELYEIHPLPGG